MKKLVFVNEDIFIDFFVQSDQNKFLFAKNLFESLVKGKIKAFTTTPALIAVAEKLEKSYGWKKKEVAYNFELILSTPNLKINFRDVLKNALDLYQENDIGFATAYHAVVMKKMGSDVFVSHNRDFLKIKNFKKWRSKL